MQHGYPHNTKRVLLCGYFGFGNMGDEATLAAALKAFREYRLKVRVMFNPCGDFEPFSRLGAQYCNRYSPSELRRAISECDALLLTGGSLIQNETSERSLLYYTAITALAEREGKPIYMLSSGFGEVSGRLGNAFANRALARLSFAGMRTGDDIMAVKDRVRCPIVNMPDLVLLEKLHREKKRDYFAVIPKGNKVGSGSVLGLIVIAVGMFFHDKTSFYSLKATEPDMWLQFSINSVSRQRDISSLLRSI